MKVTLVTSLNSVFTHAECEELEQLAGPCNLYLLSKYSDT